MKPIIINYKSLITNEPKSMYDLKFNNYSFELIIGLLKSGNYVAIIGYPNLENEEENSSFAQYFIYESRVKFPELIKYYNKNLIYVFSLNEATAPPEPYVLYNIGADHLVDLSKGVVLVSSQEDRELANKLSMSIVSINAMSSIN